MRIFVSSVYKGLETEREHVIKAIEMAGDDAAAMEVFAARPEAPRHVCLAEIRRSDLVILIVGERYGSIDPASGLSYTHMEFIEAVRVGKPVFAFFLRPPDRWGFANWMGSAWQRLGRWMRRADSAGLRQLKSEVLEHVTPVFSERSELPAHVSSSILRFYRGHGIGGRFRAFQTTEMFFEQLMDSHAYFHHDHDLIGRSDEVSALVEFLRSERLVVTVVGAGGVGKSRLLLELSRVAAANDDLPVFRFVAPEATISEASLQELPGRPTCIVIDDAHRRTDLAELLKACRQQNREACFVLTTRPSGLGSVTYALRGMREEQHEIFDELSNLSGDDALSLAGSVLGRDAQQYAAALAESAEGNVLIITVGGRAIQEGRIAPNLLDRKEEFRRLALDRIIEGLPDTRGFGADARRLLEVVATIGPIEPSAPDVRDRLAAYFDVSGPDVVRSIRELERSRLLLRRGHSVRVTPDVLADHLLFQASVDQLGEPTGFVDHVASHFGWDFLENCIANAGELEWRSRSLGTETQVLDEIWAEFFTELPQLTHRQRRDLLKRLERAAVFVPERVLELIEWLLEYPTAPEDDALEVFGSATSQESVERVIPELLRWIAQHPGCTERAARLLWQLSQRPQFGNPLFSPLPINTLKHLAEYRADQRLLVQDRIVTFMKEIVDAGAHEGASHSPSEVLAGALSREGSSESYAAGTITIGRFIIDPSNPVVASIRESALATLKKMALDLDPKHAVSSISVLRSLLRQPGIGFPGELPESTENLWREEGSSVAKVLGDVARESATISARLGAYRRLQEWREDEWPQLAGAISEILENLETVPDQTLYLALSGPVDQRLEGDFEQLEDRHRQLSADAASALWDECATCEELLSHVSGPASELERAGALLPQGVSRLFRALGVSRTDLAAGLVEALIDSELPLSANDG